MVLSLSITVVINFYHKYHKRCNSNKITNQSTPLHRVLKNQTDVFQTHSNTNDAGLNLENSPSQILN